MLNQHLLVMLRVACALRESRNRAARRTQSSMIIGFVGEYRQHPGTSRAHQDAATRITI